MITEIRLKKGSGVPSSLKLAEPAIDLLEKILYIGTTDNENGGSDFIRIIDENKVKELIAQNALGNDLIFVGDGENSIVLNRESNKAFGNYSISVGDNNISGIKGYYYTKLEHVRNDEELGTINYIYYSDNKDGIENNDLIMEYEQGDIISLVNGNYYINCGQIEAIYPEEKKIMISHSNFPIEDGGDWSIPVENHLFFVIDKPTIGIVALGANAFSTGYDTIAFGYASHTEGARTAANMFAHAEGLNTKALGEDSHTEGKNTQTIGNHSHAEGHTSKAIGYISHAEGSWTTASGEHSHSEGSSTQANGAYTHAENRNTQANGNASHAEGSGTISGGSYSHAEGYQTNSIGSGSHSEGYTTKSIGDNSHAEGNSTQSVGNSSHSEGTNTQANGSASHAEGENTIATGIASHSEGYQTTAFNNYTHAEGYKTIASEACAHVEGSESKAEGGASHAEGVLTTSTGEASHSEGRATTAGGQGAHAEGISSKATGFSSHAEGYGTESTHNSSHSEGYQSKAKGDFCHAEGVSTEALGNGCHVEGSQTRAYSYYSHAEGYKSISVGNYSHAEGEQTTAAGKGSHAEGLGTQANGEYQHTQGKWNLIDSEQKYAHIVGNGTSNINRANIHTLDWNGNACYVGDVYANGANTETGKKLATEEYVDNAIGDIDLSNVMNMINNLHYYCNKDIVYNKDLFNIDNWILFINCLNIINGELVIPYDLGAHDSIEVTNPENVTKIIIPRNMELKYNNETMTDEDLVSVFINLKTIVRIHKDGAVLSFDIENSALN